LERGVTTIRWTADPLSVGALALYLGSLGARLVAYEPELYAAVRPGPVVPDDVVIEWPLTGVAEAGRRAARVEIPLERSGVAPVELARWRFGVRHDMTHALEAGGVGTAVAVDRSAGRAFVLFSEAA